MKVLTAVSLIAPVLLFAGTALGWGKHSAPPDIASYVRTLVECQERNDACLSFQKVMLHDLSADQRHQVEQEAATEWKAEQDAQRARLDKAAQEQAAAQEAEAMRKAKEAAKTDQDRAEDAAKRGCPNDCYSGQDEVDYCKVHLAEVINADGKSGMPFGCDGIILAHSSDEKARKTWGISEETQQKAQTSLDAANKALQAAERAKQAKAAALYQASINRLGIYKGESQAAVKAQLAADGFQMPWLCAGDWSLNVGVYPDWTWVAGCSARRTRKDGSVDQIKVFFSVYQRVRYVNADTGAGNIVDKKTDRLILLQYEGK